jgi:hypothetical protein
MIQGLLLHVSAPKRVAVSAVACENALKRLAGNFPLKLLVAWSGRWVSSGEEKAGDRSIVRWQWYSYNLQIDRGRHLLWDTKL